MSIRKDITKDEFNDLWYRCANESAHSDIRFVDAVWRDLQDIPRPVDDPLGTIRYNPAGDRIIRVFDGTEHIVWRAIDKHVRPFTTVWLDDWQVDPAVWKLTKP